MSAPRPNPEPSTAGPATQPVRLHPRNRHKARHDFARMFERFPALARFQTRNAHGHLSLDFTNPEAVKAFNQALLADYGISGWDIPPGHLCPPIPGRADYLHCLADLLAETHQGQIPRGVDVRVLDIGVGANGIYPLLGCSEYGWRFLGSDICAAALENVHRILTRNARLAETIELRLQPQPAHIFHGLLLPGETFALTLCNPPFHASAEQAIQSYRGRLRSQGLMGDIHSERPNFGGHANELWCPGGETAFLERMIAESVELGERVLWFTSLVSKAGHLPRLYQALEQAGAQAVRTIDMAQGRKQSRLLAWSFLSQEQRRQ